MAQTTDQSQALTLSWLKFFQDLALVRQENCVHLQQYAWSLKWDLFAELTKNANVNANVLFTISRPHVTDCPEPEESLLEWLHPSWRMSLASNPECYVAKLNLKLPVEDTVNCESTGALSAAEWSVLSGKSAYVASLSNEKSLAHDIKIKVVECVRFIESQSMLQELTSALESSQASDKAQKEQNLQVSLSVHEMVQKCSLWSEQESLQKIYTSWLLKRQAWLQVRNDEVAALKLYNHLQYVYSMLQLSSGQLELCLTNGLLQVLANDKLDKQEQVANSLFDEQESQATEDVVEDKLSFVIEHPLLFRSVQLVFDARLEQFSLLNTNDKTEFNVALLKTLATDADFTQYQAQASNLHPLDRSAVHAFNEQLGKNLSHCLVSAQAVTDRDLMLRYSCLLSAEPVLLVRPWQFKLQEHLSVLSKRILQGDKLSLAANSLLGLKVSSDSYDAQSEELLVGELADNAVSFKLQHLSCESLEHMMSHPLNPQQQATLMRLEKQPVVVVQAPLGSGQSYTAANLISQALATQRRILVTASCQDTLESVILHLPESLRAFCATKVQGWSINDFSDITTLDSNKLALELASLEQERKLIFNELLERRTSLFNYLSFDNLNIYYQNQSYTCAQLDDFVKEYAACAGIIPFTPNLDSPDNTVNPSDKDAATKSKQQEQVGGQEQVDGHEQVEGQEQVISLKPQTTEQANTQKAGNAEDDLASKSQETSTEHIEAISSSEVVEPLSKIGSLQLVDLPLSLEELGQLYATNESIPVAMEEQLKLAWPELRSLPQPSQFLELLQSLSRMQQNLDHAQNWQVDLNLAQEMVWFRPHNGATSAIFGERIQLMFNAFEPNLCAPLSFGLMNELPEWLNEVYGLSLDSERGQKFKVLSNGLLALHNALLAWQTKANNRKIEINPQVATNPSAIHQLHLALQFLVRQDNEADQETADASVLDKGLADKIQQAKALVEKALRINRQQVQGHENLLLAHDFVFYQKIRLRCAQLWQELITPLSHVAFDKLDEEQPEKIAIRLGYMMHWLLHWSSDRQGLLGFWQERFSAVGWSVKLNLQLQDPASNTLQRALQVWLALQRAGQEVVFLAQQVVRYYRYCLSYNRVLKLLNQPDFQNNPCCCLLLQAMKRRDPSLYANAFKQLQQVSELMSDYKLRCELLDKLSVHAYEWSQAIALRKGEHGKGQMPANIEKAWQYWQFAQCLAQLTAHAQSHLTQQFTPLKEQFYAVSRSCIEKQALLTRAKISLGSQDGLELALQVFDAWVVPYQQILATPQLLRAHFDVLVIEQAQHLTLSAESLMLFNLAEHVLVSANYAPLVKANNAELVASGSDFSLENKEDRAFSGFADGLDVNVLQKLELGELISSANLSLESIHLGTKSLFAYLKQYVSSMLWHEQFTQMPQLLKWSNQEVYNGRLHALCVPRFTSLTPCCLFVQAKEYPLQVAVSLVQACCEQYEYNKRSIGVMCCGFAQDRIQSEQTLSVLLDERLSTSLKTQHQIRCGRPELFGSVEYDVVFVVLGPHECSLDTLNQVMGHVKEQLWVISDAQTKASAFTEYACHIHETFNAQKPGVAQVVGALLDTLQQDKSLEASKLQFMQQLVKLLCEKGFQLQIMLAAAHSFSPSAVEQEQQLIANGQEQSQIAVGDFSDPTGIVILYRQKRMRLECHSESELSHPESILNIMQRHERYEHYGYSVLHVSCATKINSVVEQVEQQLQREGFYPENLRGFVHVLLRQSAIVLLHRIQQRTQELLAQSHLSCEKIDFAVAPHLQHQMLNEPQDRDGVKTNADARQSVGGNEANEKDASLNKQYKDGASKQDASRSAESAQSISDDLKDATKANQQDASLKQNSATSAQLATSEDGYASYKVQDPEQNQLLSQELERVMTKREQEYAESTYQAGEYATTQDKVEAQTEVKYNYRLARLGLKKIDQPMPDPLPTDPHERFRAFKRLLFGMLKQLHLSYIDLLSSYQIVAVTPGPGQTQQFLLLCEMLRLRPNIYTPSKPMAKRVWCIKQADLMSFHAHEAAVELCRNSDAQDVCDEDEHDKLEHEAAYEVDYQQAYANKLRQGHIPRMAMAEGDENSPLVAALNRALNPYWGEVASEEQQRELPQTMRALQRRQGLHTWQAPRSTNQFLREQLLPPPMRRSMNREDVNTLAVLSMIPKQNALPTPSKAKMHTLRVTNGRTTASTTHTTSRRMGSYEQADKSMAKRALQEGNTNAVDAQKMALNVEANAIEQENAENMHSLTKSQQKQDLLHAQGAKQQDKDSRQHQAQGLKAKDELNNYQQDNEQSLHAEDETDAQASVAMRLTGISDQHLQNAAKQIENANLAEGEFSLSSIFNIPEVSSAVSESMAKASHMQASQQNQEDNLSYGAKVANSSRIKRVGAVDYPGMRQKTDELNQAESLQGHAQRAIDHKTGKVRGFANTQDGTLTNKSSLSADSEALKASESVTRQIFNADAAVAELLMQYEQESVSALEANMKQDFTAHKQAVTTGDTTQNHAKTTETLRSDNVMVRGSIMGIGEIEDEMEQRAHSASMQNVAKAHTLTNRTALNIGGELLNAHHKNKPHIQTPATQSASLAKAQALSQAAYGGSSYNGHGIGQSKAQGYTTANLSNTQQGQSALGDGRAKAQSHLSNEQLSYLAMLLQRSDIWFKQERGVLQVKVLPSQEATFKDICKAMHLSPRLMSSSQGSAHYNEWWF